MLRSVTWSRRTAAIIAAPSAASVIVAMLAAGPVQAGTARTSPLPGTRPTWASAARDVGSAPSRLRLTTQVYLAGDRAGLAGYAQAVTNPHSVDYRHFLTPAQVSRRFGATPGQVSAVEAWLRGSGLRARRVSQQEIDATGTVAATERAYGTRLDEYKTKTGTFRAPVRDAQVPAGVADDLLSVGGLDSRPVLMKPAGQTGPARPGIGTGKLPLSQGSDGAPYLGPTPCSQYYGQVTDTTDPEINGAHQPYAVCGYTPAQLRGAYNLLPFQTGRGVTIAITDAYGSSTIESDANTYAANHGQQPFAPGQYTQTVTPGSWTNQAGCGGGVSWATEQTLDVEAVHALAPGAAIHYYGANSCYDSDFIAVLSAIIDNHTADVISDSWGEVIASSTGNLPPSTINVYNQLFEQAATEGIEVAFSAGDCGGEDPATSCGTNDTSAEPQADFPDSDPWVTSVGGTAVEIGQYNNVERTVPWGDDAWLLNSGSWDSAGWIYGGGGGTSSPVGAFPGFAQPWYQKGVVPVSLAESLPNGQTAAQPMRVTPDVSMDADPETGFLMGQTQALPDGSVGYAENDIGGTSLASPLFAALVADGVQSHVLSRGFVNPALYRDLAFLPLLFHQVVTPSAATAPYEIVAPYDGSPAVAVQMGDDRQLVGTPGYSDAGGVGMPRFTFPGFGG